MAPLPRLQVVQPDEQRRMRRRTVRTTTIGQAAAGAALVAGLAAVAVALGLIYLPAGILAAGLELTLGAIAYTLGSRRDEARRR